MLFAFLLGVDRGANLRNRIAHGCLPKTSFADRLDYEPTRRACLSTSEPEVASAEAAEVASARLAAPLRTYRIKHASDAGVTPSSRFA